MLERVEDTVLGGVESIFIKMVTSGNGMGSTYMKHRWFDFYIIRIGRSSQDRKYASSVRPI